MEELNSVLDIDRDYTLVVSGKSIDEVSGDIVAVELATGKTFKVIELPSELSEEEKRHLFEMFPKQSYKNWERSTTEYYIDRIYKEVFNSLVRTLVGVGIKDLDKYKSVIDKNAVESTKKIYESYKNIIREHIQNKFNHDLQSGKIIAMQKGDDIVFTSIEDGVMVLTEKMGMLWSEDTGYSLFEFLIEAIAQNEGDVKYTIDGVNVWVLADEHIYNEHFNKEEGDMKAVIDLWGGWCHPCRLFEEELMPFLKDKDITLVRVSTDFNSWSRNILHKYGSEGIPLVILKDGWYEHAIRGYREGIVESEVKRFFESKGEMVE